MKGRNYIVSLSFLLVLAVVWLNQLLGMWHFENESENRVLAGKPEFNIQHLDPFPKAYEHWYKDHFSFRSPFLKGYHAALFYGFRTSPHPDRIVMGNSGRLFEADLARDLYEGRNGFSPQQNDSISRLWDGRAAYFESLNIRWRWVIAPMNLYVYQEELPMNFIPAVSESRTQKLIRTLSPDVAAKTIYMLPSLQEKNEWDHWYHFYDNHWTERAGFLATQMVLASLQRDFPQLKILQDNEVEWRKEERANGNAAMQLGMSALKEWYEIGKIKKEKALSAPDFGYEMPEGFAYPDAFERYFKKEKPENGLRALVIMDSFGERMMPFLKESFDESLFIFDAWQYRLNEDIVATYKPDVVVYITFEKLLASYLRRDR